VLREDSLFLRLSSLERSFSEDSGALRLLSLLSGLGSSAGTATSMTGMGVPRLAIESLVVPDMTARRAAERSTRASGSRGQAMWLLVAAEAVGVT